MAAATSYHHTAYEQASKRGVALWQAKPRAAQHSPEEARFIDLGGKAVLTAVSLKESLRGAGGRKPVMAAGGIRKLHELLVQIADTGRIDITRAQLDEEIATDPTHKLALSAFGSAARMRTRIGETEAAADNFRRTHGTNTQHKRTERKKADGRRAPQTVVKAGVRVSVNGKRVGRPPGAKNRPKQAPEMHPA